MINLLVSSSQTSIVARSRNFETLSWNFNICHNLLEQEIEELSSSNVYFRSYYFFIRMLFHIYLSSAFPDLRFWSLASFGLFLVLL